MCSINLIYINHFILNSRRAINYEWQHNVSVLCSRLYSAMYFTLIIRIIALDLSLAIF